MQTSTRAARSLEETADVIEELCRSSSELVGSLRSLSDRSRQADLVVAFDDGAAEALQRVAELQRELTAAGSRLRRHSAKELHEGGMTTEQIADLFGVTRQRISALLATEPST